ncbi:aldehyde dehydrogenase family protein [Streptomyces brasiliensis]|uniref:Aldehyde dehydrogenase n=1 Tax=Streptomyces brasiliensis TaxID=1954 RepID=A0A917KDB5_9ACTN|nr:aldehyde dehydrogenase family protein [Streptomyces brasiliensis]GGJ06353.1 aldehyde dehydrogenase [Streptomyces brasiliensis]
MLIEKPVKDSSYIGGSWSGARGSRFDVENPATEETLATIASASEADVDAAVRAATGAARDWGRAPGGVRGAHVSAIGDLIRAHEDELAELLTAEGGKPVGLARWELGFAAGYADFTAGWDRRLDGEIIHSDNPDEVINLVRVPMGVVAAITAWNFPIALFVRKITSALVAGNTVVVKPSELTPLATAALVRLIDEELDLPPGVLNLVNGDAAVGRALVTHPGVDLVTFTGHRDTGKAVMRDAAANLTRVSLELGGKAPAIVWADADLDRAVESVVNGRHANSGQVCTSTERVIVHADVFDAFAERYLAAVAGLRLGDPRSDVDLGPVVSAGQLRKCVDAIEGAVKEGAIVALGGGRPDGAQFEQGHWLAPTVLTDVRPEMKIMHEEVFGPVTPIVKVHDYREAFELANATRYGLAAYLYTEDYRTALRAAQDLDFGELYVNRSLGEQVQGHHSGHKESGFGGEDGRHGVLRYTQLRTVYHNFG